MAMTRNPTTTLMHETVRFLLGLGAVAALTGLCFWLDLGIVSTAFTYLILIVVLSLAGGFISLIALSFIAVGCLNYFFVPPLFAFRVDYPSDVIALATFLITSLVITGLVARMTARQAELADALNGLSVLVWNTSSDGSADFSNQRFRDYTGLSSKELHGLGWMTALHPEDFTVEKWRAALATGRPFEKEGRIRSASGEYRWFLLRMTPLRNERGTILKWYGTGGDLEERKQALEALRDSEERWRAVFEHNPTMYFMLDAAGTVLSVNPYGADQLGYSVNELVGRSVMDVFYEADRPAIRRNTAVCLERLGQSTSWEARKQHKDGTVLWVRETARGMLVKQRPVLLVVCEDITDRKRAEQSLRRSEAYLTDAQKISRTGSFAYDVASRRMVHSSEEHHRLFGFDPAAGMPPAGEWPRRIHPDDREKAIDAMLKRLREQMDYEVDFRTIHPDGTIKHIHSVSHAVLSPSGDLVEIRGTSTDITDLKRAEYLAEHVFETIPDIVSIVGRDYRYRRVNPAHERFWGISVEKVIGMHAGDVIGRQAFERLAKPSLDRCFAGEEVSVTDWIDGPSGRRYCAATYTPLRLETERVESALVLARDLTDHMLASERLRDAQAELAHANRVATIGQLTASIAHEVNQPVGALVTNAHAALRLLRAEPPDLDPALRALDDIIKDGRRVSEVIAGIRALIKKSPTQIEVLDINQVVMETIALTRGEILKNGVSMETDLADELPFVRGDRVQLQQVIMNMVMNAVEAMSNVDKAMRELQIGTGKDGEDTILLTVRDSGPMLKSESLDRFFQPFYSTKPSGMGIGLSICRSIVEAHGGRIWVTGNAPHGVTLHITLPALREARVG
jgi:PAS domain S-box-containing protein